MAEFRPSDLSVDSVASYWNRRDELFASDSVDLSDLKTLDSSAVAFLVQWSKSHGEGFRLTLKNTPEKLQGLIKTFRLEGLFVLQSA